MIETFKGREKYYMSLYVYIIYIYIFIFIFINIAELRYLQSSAVQIEDEFKLKRIFSLCTLSFLSVHRTESSLPSIRATWCCKWPSCFPLNYDNWEPFTHFYP